MGAGTGISVSTDTLSTNDSEIVHDNLSGFVADEHKNHANIDIASGAGLTGGGDITATRTLAVGAGTGITVNADDIEVDINGLSVENSVDAANDAIMFHDSGVGHYKILIEDLPFTNNTGDITAVSVTAGTGLSGGGSVNSGAFTATLDVTGLTVSELAASSLTTSSESFANNDTTLMTSAAIEDKILSYGYTTNTGDITSVVAGTGLSGGNTSGDATLNIDFSGLTLAGSADATNDELLFNDNGVGLKIIKIEDLPFSNNNGTVTNIATGTGISGGPITSTGTLSLALSDVIANSSTANAVLTSDGDGTLTGETELTYTAFKT